MSKYITELANDIAKSCPDLVENGCGNDNCVSCLAFKLIGLGYQKQEWISVDERLPEDGVWVLGYSAKSGRGGLCNCLKSYVREFGNYDDTTHWLPLPEFPKKKGE